MRAWRFGEFGLDALTLEQLPDPTPGPKEVRVRVHAASLNFRDLLMIRGQYNPKLRLPIVPLSDGAGFIDAVGPGVPEELVGEKVAGMFAPYWTGGEPEAESVRATLGGPLDGALADYMVLPVGGVSRVPDHMSMVEAATLPCAALTAWSALIEQGCLRPGETVLVLGSGGVSVFALQIARLAGARVLATSSSPEKGARLKDLGASEVVNYEDEPRWGRRVRELTGGRGVDHVVEVGGAGTMEQSLRAVRLGGHVALIGVLSGVSAPLALTPILMGNIRVQGVFVGSRERFSRMVGAFEEARLRPVIDEIFPFEEAPRAFERLSSSKHVGKVVIEAEDTG